MLPLSDLTITFKQSKDYLRLVIFIHLLVIIVLLHSAFSWPVIAGLLMSLSLPMMQMIRHRNPLSAYISLSYHARYWLLHCANGNDIKYETMDIHFDAGIFILLTLSSGSQLKTLVIFKDQLTRSQHRLLTFIVSLGACKKNLPKESGRS